jgi:microcystin-dependent protein
MSQNDLVIANQTFPATRADINSALQALGSNNSGSSAPTTTYANMLWYDTGTNTLKMRAEANDAWIDLGTLDQSSLSFSPANAVPVGAVNTFAMSSAPTGWLSCDGGAVSRTTYATLFATVGTTYGSGNGSTTFNVPDLRGEFVRGWDDGRGVDSGRGFGTTQSDEIKSHSHTISHSSISGVSAGGQIAGGSPPNSTTSPTQATGGTETRPRNIALLYCIKH